MVGTATRARRHRDYGEARYISVGQVEAAVVAVVHTWRDGRVRLVSAWPARRSGRVPKPGASKPRTTRPPLLNTKPISRSKREPSCSRGRLSPELCRC